MDKHPARREQQRAKGQLERQEDLPTLRKTRPRGNPEIHRADLERSTERLEMLLGH